MASCNDELIYEVQTIREKDSAEHNILERKYATFSFSQSHVGQREAKIEICSKAHSVKCNWERRQWQDLRLVSFSLALEC